MDRWDDIDIMSQYENLCSLMKSMAFKQCYLDTDKENMEIFNKENQCLLEKTEKELGLNSESESSTPCEIEKTIDQDIIEYINKLTLRKVLNKFQGKTALRILVEILDDSKKERSSFLNSPMGSGKTRMSFVIAVYLMLRKIVQNVLFVFVPNTEDSCKTEFDVVQKSMDKINFPKTFFITSKMIGDRNKSIQRWKKEGGILFIGKQLLMTGKNSEPIDKAVKELSNNGFDGMFIMDECHPAVKHDTMSRTVLKMYKRLKFSLFISASILPKGVESILEVQNLIENSFGTNIGRLGFNLGIKNDVFEHSIEKVSSLVTKNFHLQATLLKEYLNSIAPLEERKRISSCETPIEEMILCIPLTKTMETIYKMMIKNVCLPMFTHERRELHFLNIKSYLEQVLSPLNPFVEEVEKHANYYNFVDIPVDYDNYNDDGHSAKIEIIRKLVDEYRTKREKVIIFSGSLKTLIYLKNIWDEDSEDTIAIYIGCEDEEAKNAQLEKFKNSPSCSILLMSITLAIGLNLQEASVVIIMEPKYSSTVTEQAIGRVARKNQEKPVKVFHLLYKNTIEEKIFEINIKNRNFIDWCHGAEIEIRSFSSKGSSIDYLNLVQLGENPPCKYPSFNKFDKFNYSGNSIGTLTQIEKFTSDILIKN